MTDHDLERRVQRATEPLAEWLGTIAGRLHAFFVCEVRPVTREELEREPRTPTFFGPASSEGSFAVVPSSAEAATLVVLRHEFMTGTGVSLFFGDLAHEAVPCCDECALLPQSEEDRDDLASQAEEVVWVATRGFAEFRRPAEDDTGGDVGPWFEEGWLASEGGSTWSGPGVPAEPLQRIWRPWRRRRDLLPRTIGGVPVGREPGVEGGYAALDPGASPGVAPGCGS